MKRRLLPIALLSLLCGLSACDYGVYCHVRNSSARPVTVTVVESIVQDKKASKRSGMGNRGLDSFKLVSRNVAGTVDNKPVKSSYYTYTLQPGKEIDIASATAGRILSEILFTRQGDTLSRLQHRHGETANRGGYHIVVSDRPGQAVR